MSKLEGNMITKIKGFFNKDLANDVNEVFKDYKNIVFPQILFLCCLYLQGSINIFFVSIKYKDADMLNAVGISNLYVTITTAVIMSGIMGALDTLGSNAYGAKNYKLLGIYFDRCRYVALTFWISISLFHYFCARSVLGLLKVEDRVVELVLEYVSLFVFSYLFSINFQINTKHFVLIEKSHYNLMISGTSLILHTFMCGFFVCICNFGLRGVSAAVVITSIYNLIVSTVIIHRQGLPPESLVYFTKDGTREWWAFMKVAIPGILMSGGEWLGYEIQGIFAIYISTTAYSTAVLTMNLESTLFPYTFGISTAVSLKAGEKLITQSTDVLKRYISICYAFAFTLSVFVFICIYNFGGYYLYVMSPNEEIYERCIEVLGLVCWFVFADCAYYFFMGVLKAIGYLRNPTIVTFMVSYGINITLTYILAYRYELEVKGIWLSLSTGCTCGTSIFIYWVYTFDLEVIKENAIKRINHDNNKILRIEMENIPNESSDIENRLLDNNNNSNN